MTSLLDELGGLRERARADRHGYWFPLLLFGLLTLAAIPLYKPVYLDGVGSYTVPNTRFEVPGLGWVDPLGVFNSGLLNEPEYPLAIGLYWLAAPLLALAATVRWYRWRATRIGVETLVQPYKQVTIAGFAVVLGIPLAGALLPKAVLRMDMSTELELVLSIALVGIGVADTVPATRMSSPAKPVVPMVVLLSVLGVLVVHKTGGLLLFAIGLLVLAWLERSWWCAAVALAFTGFTLIANIYAMGRIFYWLGWNFACPWHDTLFAAKDLIFPSVVLVPGGLGALLARRRVSR